MKRISLLLFVLLLVCSSVYAQPAKKISFISEQIISNPTVSTTVVVPVDADYAIVSISANPVHINMYGGTATTSNFEMPISTQTWHNPRLTLHYWRVINTTAGASKISIAYFRYQ